MQKIKICSSLGQRTVLKGKMISNLKVSKNVSKAHRASSGGNKSVSIIGTDILQPWLSFGYLEMTTAQRAKT